MKHVFDNPLGGWLAPLAFGVLAWYCRADLVANALAASVVILAELVFVVVALFYPYALRRWLGKRRREVLALVSAFDQVEAICIQHQVPGLRDAAGALATSLRQLREGLDIEAAPFDHPNPYLP